VKYAPVPEELLFDHEISSHAKVIWGLLDRRIDNQHDSDTNGAAFPGRDWLAGHMGVSVPTVDRAIKELCAAGWVTVERPCGGRRNLYTLHDEAQQVITGEEHRSSQVKSSRSSPVMSTRNEPKGNEPKGTKPLAATPSAPADGQLDLGSSARSKPRARAGKRAANADPANAAAIKIAQPIWDSKDPRPTSPFVALVQLVRGFLEAGWTDDEVTSAGKAAPVLTRNAMELQLRQARQPAKANSAGSDDAIRKFRNRNNRPKPTPKRGDFIDVKETSNGR
jgi:hypothetical protein